MSTEFVADFPLCYLLWKSILIFIVFYLLIFTIYQPLFKLPTRLYLVCVEEVQYLCWQYPIPLPSEHMKWKKNYFQFKKWPFETQSEYNTNCNNLLVQLKSKCNMKFKRFHVCVCVWLWYATLAIKIQVTLLFI